MSFAAPDKIAHVPYTGQDLRPACLRCEYRVDPLGIGETSPRLSWIVESGQRGQRQTAYRLLVASTPELLAKDAGDLWDSGRVAGGETIAVEYAGRPLASGQRCFWKLKVWDKDGRESAWSPAALWSMGLLKPDDWKAQWIGYDKQRAAELPDAPLEGAQWIWYAADPQPTVPICKRGFHTVVTLPKPADMLSAELLATGDDTVNVFINGMPVIMTQPGSGDFRKAVQRNALRFLKEGENEIRMVGERLVDGAAGVIFKLSVKTQDGRTLSVVSDKSWKATATPGAKPTNPKAWSPCRVLGQYGMAPWGKIKAAGTITPPAVFLRSDFTAGKPVARATLYASGFGWFDMHLNGRHVSDDLFNPGWTDYTKRVYYRTYDVTSMVRQGPNALGAVLADGWYAGYIGWYGKRDHYGSRPRVMAQLALDYADGSHGIVATSPSWKAQTGPILAADILMGETYDARQELTGWDQPGYTAADWQAVACGAELSPVVPPHPGPPVVAIDEFRGKHITEPKPGVYVVDLGQNFAGFVRLKVRGTPGQKIALRHAERLDPDGTLYTINLRTAQAVDTYICKGGGVETWSPRFTFHGFQYVEITGLAAKPDADTVVGVALSSDTPVAGEFASSDPMLNQLHSNIRWTQRANFIDIPTDCPQRDERLGWTGDAQVYVRTATLNNDVQAFYTKWLVDLDDAQRVDGQFPMVAPLKVAGDDGGPAWADAGAICPWTIYEVYGDRRLLQRHYAAMCRFIEFCKSRSTPDLLPPEKFHCFGDWLSIKADTPKDLIYTAYFAYSTKLTAEAAEVLGKKDDAAKYRALFAAIKTSFNKAFVGADGRLKGNTQAGYVLALGVGLLDDAHARQAAQFLVDDIQGRDCHLSTGFIGTKDLMLVLAKINRNDIAGRLLHNDTFPSWGFSIKQGATSIWERWDGWTPDKGFQTPGMNSFAHYSFGAVYQWMVENLGGIRNKDTAYQAIFLAPTIDPRLTSCRVAYQSIRGRIETQWQKRDGRLELNVTVPANTTATIRLPAKDPAAVREQGQPLANAPGVKLLATTSAGVNCGLLSGTYHFEITGF